jgi:YD repeat-containing protein
LETRLPAPGGQDVVRYSSYDASQRLTAQSVPYLVSAYTGGLGAPAYSIPDSTQTQATYTYDALGRALTTTDALSNQSRRSYSVVCGAAGTDAGCYEQTLSIDARGHQGGTLVDGAGRTAYVQRYTAAARQLRALRDGQVHVRPGGRPGQDHAAGRDDDGQLRLRHGRPQDELERPRPGSAELHL